MKLLLCTACAYFLHFVSANAQEIECGELIEKSCGMLHSAISNWNENFSETLSIEAALYSGNEESDAFNSVLNVWSSGGNLPIATFENGQFQGVQTGNIQELDPDKIYSEQVIPVIEEMEHAIEVKWKSNEAEFSSIVLASNSYPYFFDTMISNAISVEEGNSCYHLIVKWPWRAIRGEVLLDLVPIRSPNGLVCQRVAESWMNIGSAADPLVTDVTYNGQKCMASFAYALGTPLLKITANKSDFSFEFSGIGSRITGKRDCVAP